jgi:hypothetical protein
MIKGKGIKEIGQNGGIKWYFPNKGILPLPTYDGRQTYTHMYTLTLNFAL